MSGVLEGKRVLDVSEGIPGAYCTKLFADAGADVVKAERPSGDPLRRRGTGGLFDFLHAGKQSICADWRDLAAAADILVASEAVDADALRSANPRLVIVMITPFGASGPWAGRPANEFILQAWCGSTGSRGWPDEEPISAGGEVGAYLSGTFAAVAALSALIGAGRTGRGDVIDVSMLECMAISFAYYPSVAAQFEDLSRLPKRAIDIPSIERTADGYVALTTVTAAQFDAFLILIGREDLIQDKDLATRTGRQLRHREFRAAIEAFTLKHTTDEIIARARSLRLPAAPVCNGETVLQIEHFRARGNWVRSAARGVEQPGAPYRLNGARQTDVSPVPALGEHTGKVKWSRRDDPVPGDDIGLPLSGVRVIDCTSFWAGPIGSLFLTALGAEVIHVEGPDRMDSNRMPTPNPRNGAPWWNVSSRFLALNNSKKSFVVDLKHPDGVALFKELLATADVFLENNSPRVMDGFGLSWENVRQINPALIMTRMSAFGLEGPWREHVAYAFTAEAVSGLAWATGWPGGPPTVIGGPGDPLAGGHAAFATMLALLQRQESGRGVLVDACLIDPALNVAAEQTIEWQATGVTSGRYGNRSPVAAPQGLYRCAGDDSWVAISVADGEQWLRLRKALGVPPALADDALLELQGRQESHDLIDEAIRAWTGPRRVEDVVATLVDAGVPAAPVVLPATIDENPQMRHRGFFERIESRSAGSYESPVMPFRFASVAQWSRCSAPDFGEHTEHFLDELSIDPERRKKLRTERVIA